MFVLGWGPIHQVKGADRFDDVVYFPKQRYPETGAHIQDAISQGHSDVCTIDRDGADARRKESLKGIPTKPGYDRDEWPMAVCLEGGKGASVRYVTPSDNRGAGSWVSHQISGYPDGKRVLFIVR
ncbi:NucA/NucB deoxyribonuclease domain-containing protein [Bacillus sp. NPDC077027]|uniref:NucA/NucB deoxyribonuclease domain-containing protein n=1 Tax=Bacillus sp. NPDC077027 TaxID=3390548 RepID=UPI003CFF7F7E